MLRRVAAKPTGRFVDARLVRNAAVLGLIALLAACAAQHTPQVQEAAQYRAHARGNYTPPGPPEDPWGPYIAEASTRFDVPEEWIRNVMRVESGGELYWNGELVTSGAGAMGLMQVMPETYDGLRYRYSLGDDAYDPHDNILAGTAYLREMYELYGTPGFLAAYNAGPKRLDDYLAGHRALPDETRHYVAKIAPYIADAHPINRAPSEDLAMNTLPGDIPPGLRFGRGWGRPASTQYAQASTTSHGNAGSVPHLFAAAPPPRDSWSKSLPTPPAQPVAVAQARTSTKSGTAASRQYAAATVPASRTSGGGGFHLISSAMADTLPVRKGAGIPTGQWAIQVGAFGTESDAKAAVSSARGQAQGELGSGRTLVAGVQHGHAKLYRARVTGLSHDAATQACQRVARSRGSCMVVPPSES